MQDYSTENLLNELPEALLITTPSGEILFTNKAVTSLTGFTAAELKGQPVTLLLPTPERKRVDVVAWLNRWVSDPNPDQLRYLNLQLATKDQNNKLVSVRVSGHKENEHTTFLVILRDVTSETEEITSLRHAQLITNRILAIGEDAVLSINQRQEIIYWNDRATTLFGFTRDEILGQSITRILPAAVQHNHQQLVDGFVDSTRPSRLMGERGEISGQHKNGSLIPLEASITKTRIDGELIMSAQIRDITARKQAEAKLKASEARFKAIFENAVEAMVLLNPQGVVLEANASARNLLGNETPTGDFHNLNWWPTVKDKAQLEAARNRLKELVEQVAKGDPLRSRVEFTGQSGAIQALDFSLMPVRDDNQQLTYIIAEGRDILS